MDGKESEDCVKRDIVPCKSEGSLIYTESAWPLGQLSVIVLRSH